MRKLIMVCVLMLWGASPVVASGYGVGGFGGLNIPIVQDDQSSGTVFGVKGRMELARNVIVEPNLGFGKFGDAEFTFGTREGSKINAYGVDVLLGSGFGGASGVNIFGILGAGVYSITRDYDDDATKFGWSTGLGLEFMMVPTLGLDVRGKVHVTSSEGGGTKKSATVTGGLNYYFGK